MKNEQISALSDENLAILMQNCVEETNRRMQKKREDEQKTLENALRMARQELAGAQAQYEAAKLPIQRRLIQKDLDSASFRVISLEREIDGLGYKYQKLSQYGPARA